MIAVCGRMRCGKDTVADVLADTHDLRKVAFAEPLKQAAAALFALSHEQLYGHAKDVVDARWKVTPRKILQYLGTDVMQYHVHDHLLDEGDCTAASSAAVPRRQFWARRLLSELASGGRYVVCDLRFVHEWRALREMLPPATRLCVIRVVRPAVVAVPTTPEHSFACQHCSESECDDVPAEYEVVNDKGIQELAAAVRRLRIV